MGDYGRGGLDLHEEDRLPWLEPVEDLDEGDGISPVKLLGFIVAGLALIGAVVGGIYWLQGRVPGGGGEGTLIAAQPGDYKVKATDADAKKFDGEGDASYPTSEGAEANGRIDVSRLPETPVTTAPAATSKAAPAKPATKVTATVEDDTKKAAPKANAVGPRGAAGAMIQLGAYNSQAIAKDAWGRLSKRFDYLASLGTTIQEVKVGDNTFYRLRASAGSTSNASALCGKLKVAGESCLVVN